MTSLIPAKWWHALPDGRIQCDLCPRDCKLKEGQPGHCFVRQRHGDQIVLTTYGFSSGFAVDPIEKKPLNHFLPGTRILSFGTAGCNLACQFCQNWDLSRSRDIQRTSEKGNPKEIADWAASYDCQSVAFTYNDPVIFAEYAMDVAQACHSQGLHTVAVTAGYIREEPRKEFFQHMDAANIDLKGFSEAFYHKLTGAHLQDVLDTLVYVKHETSTWLEITTLLIPGKNDSSNEIQQACEWIQSHLGEDVPLHFTAFHPDHKLTEISRTPLSTLERARSIATDVGLRYVYTGNLPHSEGGRTICPECQRVLIQRHGYEIEFNSLEKQGICPKCHAAIPGRF